MTAWHLWIALAGAGLAASALAQYKVVGPDGRITYTDRPPVNEPGKVTAMPRGSAPASGPAGADGALPFELRQLVNRYPVTLYTGANCAPCNTGRQLLQQRGVPYVERLIASEEDLGALERLSGGRTIPSLTVGAQPLRGYNATDWANYLDVAGYPRESRLPRGWQPQPATPLVARESAAPASAPATAAAAPPPPAATPAPAPAPGTGTTIRF